ncbi:MAG: response regulator [Wenzhouxiangella sp.]|nr:MAG: response regulator [Wenzhouxiangella sp.]
MSAPRSRAGADAIRPPQAIVLVEDHPELANYLGQRLREYAPVVIFTDAESALAHLRQLGCRALISDVGLPGMSGVELCRQIRMNANLAAIPVILMSAMSSDASRHAAMDAGATAFLTKPFKIGDLKAALATG